MTATAPNPYLKTKVLTASPAELRLMLFDGAIKFLEQGKSGLETKDYEASFNGISRCQEILMELLNGLRPEVDKDLCEKLSGLYIFMYTQLVKACTEKDIDVVNEVLGLLQYERETWVLLMEQLANENDAATGMQDLPQVAPPQTPVDSADDRDDLVGGSVSVQG